MESGPGLARLQPAPEGQLDSHQCGAEILARLHWAGPLVEAAPGLARLQPAPEGQLDSHQSGGEILAQQHG